MSRWKPSSLDLRRTRSLGVKRLRNELIRQHDLQLSLDTIHRVLVRHGAQHFDQARLRRKGARQYSRPIPGDRVQMDVCKIAPGIYQYTAIDDCSRYKVLGVYPRRNAKSTLSFLERVVEEMPRFLSSAFRLIAGSSSSCPKMSNAG